MEGGRRPTEVVVAVVRYQRLRLRPQRPLHRLPPRQPRRNGGRKHRVEEVGGAPMMKHRGDPVVEVVVGRKEGVARSHQLGVAKREAVRLSD